jgi:hypothetical protein
MNNYLPNVICGAFTLNFDKHSHVLNLFTIPSIKAFQFLETLGLGIDSYEGGWGGLKVDGRFVVGAAWLDFSLIIKQHADRNDFDLATCVLRQACRRTLKIHTSIETFGR